jgi:integrase
MLVNEGGKYWRWRYRYAGKQKTLALGVYPATSFADARERHMAARRLLADGVDPSQVRRETKLAARLAGDNLFEGVAREWFKKHEPTWAATHAVKVIARLEGDVFPWLGKRPISEIKAPEILAVLRRIEGRGAVDTAHRIKQSIGQIFRYAIGTIRAERDPTTDLKGALATVRQTHYAAILEPAKVGEMLRAFAAFNGTFIVQSALRLAPLLFVRIGELRQMEWSHVNLDKAEWRYAASKTKTDHLVPLSTQSVAILRDLHKLTGNGRYVFPGGRSTHRPMSDAAINAALRRMGFDTKTEITGHGFRAMARTLLAEELHWKPEIIEHQLAHAVPDALGSAYNRTKFIRERVEMMQAWADYLDRLKTGAKVIPLVRSA